MGLRTLVKKITVATSVMQSSSNELSTLGGVSSWCNG